eukprot:4399409-Ditylum_brightwellii.AAC.1
MIEVLAGAEYCHGVTGCPGICQDSYCPELTGLLTGLAALLHLCVTHSFTHFSIEVACDNEGALTRCASFHGLLLTSDSNSDILRAIYRLMSHLETNYQIHFL